MAVLLDLVLYSTGDSLILVTPLRRVLHRIGLDLVDSVLGLRIEVNGSVDVEITIISIINYNLLTSGLSPFSETAFGLSGASGTAAKGC